MPLNIQTNINSVKTSAFFSKTAEIITIASMLADTKHHEYARPIYEKILEELSDDSRKTLELFSSLPFQGLEILELVLDTRCYDSVDAFCDKIAEYSEEYFVYYLAGEMIELSRIRELKADKKQFDTFLSELPWVVRGNTAVFEYSLYNTDSFRQDLTRVLKELDNEYINELLTEHAPQYEQAVNDMRSKLQSHSPAEVEGLALHRKMDENPSIREYVFVPSLFVNPHYLQAFNTYAHMTVFDINIDEREKRIRKGEQMAEKLKVLSDKTRLELVRLLILQPTYGKLLAARLGLTTATISHHLEQLKSYNLVKESRSKNTKFFSADIEEIDALLDGLKNYLYNK